MIGQPPPAQHRERGSSRDRQDAKRDAGGQAEGRSGGSGDSVAGGVKEKGKAPGLKTEPAKRSVGKAGEQNLRIEAVPVPLGRHLPSYFNVSGAAGNALEAKLEQLAYRKSYTGVGGLRTDVIPVVPIGTRGRLVVRDTTTGEVLEQPWTWVPIGGLSLFGLIAALFRKLFTNG